MTLYEPSLRKGTPDEQEHYRQEAASSCCPHCQEHTEAMDRIIRILNDMGLMFTKWIAQQ